MVGQNIQETFVRIYLCAHSSWQSIENEVNIPEIMFKYFTEVQINKDNQTECQPMKMIKKSRYLYVIRVATAVDIRNKRCRGILRDFAQECQLL